MYIHLDTTPECDEQMNGRTDGQTDLLKQYRVLHAEAC